MNNLTLGISPCPNDTFIFEAWITGLLSGAEHPHVTFADVQTLNEQAQLGAFDVVKVSCGCLSQLLDTYQILQSGGAMGFGCGPLLLSSTDEPFNPDVETWLPGRDTTASLLFSHWCTSKGFAAPQVHYALFDEVYRALGSGEARQGVVIHEHRFTWARDGLFLLQDLGAHWESATGSPIPLGVILARKDLGAERIGHIEEWIRASLAHAWERPLISTPFLTSHAQETSNDVVEAHVRMFVNDFSMDIGEQGKNAISTLLKIQAQRSTR